MFTGAFLLVSESVRLPDAPVNTATSRERSNARNKPPSDAPCEWPQ
jgi:hypothetical protein